MSFDISNYTTVNERILQFFTLHPKGVISTAPARIIEIGQQTFISVTAEVYTEYGSLPILAEAWEVFPGKTPYTRDSEMMNAATSAIGRALMQLGIGIDKAGASAEEVQHRAPVTQPKNQRFGEGKSGAASEKQIDTARRMMSAVNAELKAETLRILTGKTAFEDLTRGDMDQFFKDDFKARLADAENQAATGALKVLDAKPVDDPWAVEKW